MGIPAITTTLPAATVQKAWAAAQDFEAVALGEFLKPMFETVDLGKAPMGGGSGEEQWKPMLIDAVSKQIARSGGLGLAQPVFMQMIKLQESRETPPA